MIRDNDQWAELGHAFCAGDLKPAERTEAEPSQQVSKPVEE
jgi:hypothetical protein